jgi:hypothetical protein
MPSLSNITRADPVTYTAQLGPESVTVTFDAAKMTGRWEREIRAARDTEDVSAVGDLILGIFIDWDVTDDAGQPVPIAKEILLDLPAKALGNLIDGMTTAAFPSSEEGNGSGNISSTADTDSTNSRVIPPNGQVTSPLPELSASASQT